MRAVVDTFYLYLVTDPETSRFFANISMGRMRHLQASFVGMVLGSGQSYRGRDMRAHLGITHDVFDQTVSHLVAALLHHAPQAPQPVLAAVLDAVEGLRTDVVSEDRVEEGEGPGK